MLLSWRVSGHMHFLIKFRPQKETLKRRKELGVFVEDRWVVRKVVSGCVIIYAKKY
jgi:hypothetical protein